MEKISIDEEEVRVKEIDREYAQWKMETLSAQVEILANDTEIFQSILFTENVISHHRNLSIDLIYGNVIIRLRNLEQVLMLPFATMPCWFLM